MTESFLDWEKKQEVKPYNNLLGVPQSDLKGCIEDWKRRNLPYLINVLDLETTALQEWKGSIVEVGICTLDLNSGKVESIFEAICNEGKDFDEFAWIFCNSDLSVDEVKTARPLEEFREQIQILQEEIDPGKKTPMFSISWNQFAYAEGFDTVDQFVDYFAQERYENKDVKTFSFELFAEIHTFKIEIVEV